MSTPDGDVSIMLWDLAGEVAQSKVPRAYFLGAKCVLYVIDLSLPFTWKNMESDLIYIREIVPNAVIKIVGNKKDLLTSEELEKVVTEITPSVAITTSAKTGENIENLFKTIANEILKPTSIFS